jgi:hypothetical protein
MRFASAVIAFALVSSTAWAGPALDDSTPASSGSASTDAMATPAAPPPSAGTGVSADDDIHYGVDIRLRSMYVPTWLLNAFLTRAFGANNFGYGIDVIRRHGDLELAIGLEHEQITVGQGVWINSGDTVPQDDPDYVVTGKDAQDSGLGWTTIDFTFINHKTINKYVSFRYGAGAGIGIINGALDHYNVHCNGGTNSMPEPGCVPTYLGGQGQVTDPNGNAIGTNTQYKYDIPPVFPVIDVVIGFQFHPIDKMIIDIEGGLHTLPYFGANVGYMFN